MPVHRNILYCGLIGLPILLKNNGKKLLYIFMLNIKVIIERDNNYMFVFQFNWTST